MRDAIEKEESGEIEELLVLRNIQTINCFAPKPFQTQLHKPSSA
jgi:hypothetical protein